MAKIDIKQHVTDTIISEIEKGTPPWRKPWTGDATGAALPLRHDGTAYRGGECPNALGHISHQRLCVGPVDDLSASACARGVRAQRREGHAVGFLWNL